MSALARDPDATASTLERWLGQVVGLDDVHVTDVSIPGSTGWSNETILFDATLDGGRARSSTTSWWPASPRPTTRCSPTAPSRPSSR